MLDPNAARAEDLHALKVHTLVIACPAALQRRRCPAAADDACRAVLGQRPPLRPRHLELAPEVEHRVLWCTALPVRTDSTRRSVQ